MPENGAKIHLKDTNRLYLRYSPTLARRVWIALSVYIAYIMHRADRRSKVRLYFGYFVV